MKVKDIKTRIADMDDDTEINVEEKVLVENKPIKTAVAKHDIYYRQNLEDIIATQRLSLNSLCHRHWFVGKEVIGEFLANLQTSLSSISPVVPKGAPFVCYLEDGDELWFDDVNYGIESQDKKWAELHLENVELTSYGKRITTKNNA